MSARTSTPSCRQRLFFIGNPGRGDDGIAIELLARLNASPHWQRHSGRVTAEWYFQLCPEQIYDLRDTEAVLFIDADASGADGVRLEPVVPDQHCLINSHSLPPPTLLRLFEDLFQQPAPDAWLLRIAGEHFAMTDVLSATAQVNLAGAMHYLLAWLEAGSDGVLSTAWSVTSSSVDTGTRSGNRSVTGTS